MHMEARLSIFEFELWIHHLSFVWVGENCLTTLSVSSLANGYRSNSIQPTGCYKFILVRLYYSKSIQHILYVIIQYKVYNVYYLYITTLISVLNFPIIFPRMCVVLRMLRFAYSVAYKSVCDLSFVFLILSLPSNFFSSYNKIFIVYCFIIWPIFSAFQILAWQM
jgi:hypothetical protein